MNTRHFVPALLVALVLLGARGPWRASAAPGAQEPPSPGWTTPVVRAPRLQYRTFTSVAARAQVSYHVWTPEAYDTAPSRRFPVLYWLHGTGGGLGGVPYLVRHFAAAVRAGKTPPMVVVFANGMAMSMYCDSKDGRVPMETVLVKELVPHVDAAFRTVASREGRWIEGFSMGGYGAARLGLKFPEVFGAISSLAGGPLQLDFRNAPRAGPRGRDQVLQSVYGGDLEWFKTQSPWVLATRSAGAVRTRTRMRLAIGSLDETVPANRDFHAHLVRLGILHGFTVVPGVGHNPRVLLEALGDDYWSFYREALGARAGTK